MGGSMKGWKQKTTGALYDIQTIPGPLPSEYDPEAWELVDVTNTEIMAIATREEKIRGYVHTERGLQGLLAQECSTKIPTLLEEFV